MYDIRWIRENSATFLEGLRRRHESNPEAILNDLLKRDEERRQTIAAVEGWQALINRKSREIGFAKREGDQSRVAELRKEVSRLKSDITRAGEKVVGKLDKELRDKLSQIPNIPLDEVPDGLTSDDNVEHHHFGAVRNYQFVPKQHFDIGEALGQMDFETATKLSGALFVVLKSGVAKLERA